MKFKIILIMLAGIAVFFVRPAFSVPLTCMNDHECEENQRCIKTNGSFLGVCKEGQWPEKVKNKRSTFAPLDVDGTDGDACRIDKDCGFVNKCVKETDSAFGICLR